MDQLVHLHILFFGRLGFFWLFSQSSRVIHLLVWAQGRTGIVWLRYSIVWHGCAVGLDGPKLIVKFHYFTAHGVREHHF